MRDPRALVDPPDVGGRVVVIVLNHNRPDDTIECVRSLLTLKGREPYAIDIAVVDNGSTDASVAIVRATFPEVSVLETGRNLGYGGGMNLGIQWARKASADYVWLLNNDTVVEPGGFEALIAVAESDRNIGIVGSVIVDMDDPTHVQTWGGGRVNLWLGAITRHDRPGQGPLDHVVGVSMFIRRELLDQVPGFWPCYPFYFEDVDFSCEARRRGWTLAVAPDSVIRHRIGGTIGANLTQRPLLADKLQATGVAVFIVRQSGPRALVAIPLRLVAMTVHRVRRRQVDRIPHLARAYIAGLSCALRKRPDARSTAVLEALP